MVGQALEERAEVLLRSGLTLNQGIAASRSLFGQMLNPPMCPISVCIPVAVTTARPCP